MNTFERKEIKYLITDEQRNALMTELIKYMKPDEYGESTIRNIYFDTPTGLLVRHSSEKPIYKEKMRLRSYTAVAPNKPSFLELKKKYNGIVYKRRINVSENDIYDYLNRKRLFPQKGQIANEIDYFCRYYGNIQPQMFLSYDRCAYFGKEDKDFRITFDRNILWRTTDLSLSAPVYGQPLLADNCSIMEIKILNAMPLWLGAILTSLKINKCSFSKYGSAYEEYITEKGTYKYA